MDKNENVVVAIFEDRAAAEAAIERLKAWDEASKDIKLGAIGLLYKEDGEVKSSIGHQGGRGLRIGALVGVIAGVLTGGVGVAGGAVVGGAAGGAIGSFFAKSLHLSEAECESLGQELELGKAAVVVTCDEYEISSTRTNLEKSGGAAKVYVVPSKAVDEAVDSEEIREYSMATYGIDDAVTRAGDDLAGMI